MSADVAIKFEVTGRVQGVGFRAFVSATAKQYGLLGWVKNHYDGSVRGCVQGDGGLVKDFLKQLQIGNRWSSVAGLTQTPLTPDSSLQNFEIRY